MSTHGLLMAAAFIVALLIARHEARTRKLSIETVDNLAIIAIIAGLIGARIVFVLTLGQGMTPGQMLMVWQGGLSSHGGYLFGIAAAVAYLKYKKVRILDYTDAMMPALLVGWAIGRVGCLLNWDSFGRMTQAPWAIRVDGVPYHPTQIYESLAYLIGFGLVSWGTRVSKFFHKPGIRTAASLGLFTAARYFIDFFRGDPNSYLYLSRSVTLIITVLCAAYIVRESKIFSRK
jgi:phosphatidylglycerol:prolipoprotein diacylglycerol transferase